MIFIGADHRGFKLKESLKAYLKELGFDFEDLGALAMVSEDDYPDFARLAAERISKNPQVDKGILVCGSGHGMDMAANKYKGVRAALVFNGKVARQSREHEDANVLVLASDWTSELEAKEILKNWLNSDFSRQERHLRRLKKIEEIEEKNFK